jgi:hypothetical protein
MLRYKRWTFVAWYQSKCTNIPSLAPLVTRQAQTRIPREININVSSSFHHSSLQLAYTTQACQLNLNLTNASKHMRMHIQIYHTSSWACSPYLCAQNFNWSPYFVIFLPLCQSVPLCLLFTIFVQFLPLCHQWPQIFNFI